LELSLISSDTSGVGYISNPLKLLSIGSSVTPSIVIFSLQISHHQHSPQLGDEIGLEGLFNSIPT